jgi:hypothetical protein
LPPSAEEERRGGDGDRGAAQRRRRVSSLRGTGRSPAVGPGGVDEVGECARARGERDLAWKQRKEKCEVFGVGKKKRSRKKSKSQKKRTKASASRTKIMIRCLSVVIPKTDIVKRLD